MNVDQARRIRDRRVAAVEDADLHQLVRRDIRGEGRADRLQRRPPRRKPVLDDPLPEFLAEHRPVVFDTPAIAQDRAFAVGGGGRDTVDHRIGESDVRPDPAREFRIGEFRNARDGVFANAAVAGNVVARHHGEGRDAGGATALQAGDDQPERGPRRLEALGVGNDVGMGHVEPLRGRRNVVSAFGDRQRHDADVRTAERVQSRRDVERFDEIDHRPGDADRRRMGFLLDDGRQPVLLGELVAHDGVVVPHAGADERPIMVASGAEQVVEIDRLVRAVKVADAEMHDARAELGTPIVRDANPGRHVRQRGGGEFDAHEVISTVCMIDRFPTMRGRRGHARLRTPQSADSPAVVVEAMQMRLAWRRENPVARRQRRLARQANAERADSIRVRVHERVGAEMLDERTRADHSPAVVERSTCSGRTPIVVAPRFAADWPGQISSSASR